MLCKKSVFLLSESSTLQRWETSSRQRDVMIHIIRYEILVRDWNTNFLAPDSAFPIALMNYKIWGICWGRRIHQRLHCSRSGMFQTKFCEKIYIFQSGNTWSKMTGFKKIFFLALFPGQTALPSVVSGRGHPPGLHQPQLHCSLFSIEKF